MRLLITGGSGFIGTNVMAYYLDQEVSVMNLDWNPPLNKDHAPFWKNVDIMDREAVARMFASFGPTHVLHLAARTDTDEKEDLDAYRQNHEGTRILLSVVNENASVERVIVTSSQFVCEAGYQPKGDLDFKPFTVYGESKRRTELITREAGLNSIWTIIRPTTIWGPYSLRYRDVMFKVMRKGLYFHPGKTRVIRSYGYVGNVVWQIDRIFNAEPEKVKGKVYYVGDPPFDLKEWVEIISEELMQKPVRYIPSWVIRAIARVGDLLKAMRIPFPITMERYRSMTSDYITPMDRTIAAFGPAPYTLRQGAKEMVRWYDTGSEKIEHPVRKDARGSRPMQRT